jgi:hypothetical protein
MKDNLIETMMSVLMFILLFCIVLLVMVHGLVFLTTTSVESGPAKVVIVKEVCDGKD